MKNGSDTKRNIKAVILDNGLDFGRCPLASELPAALWPIGGQAAVKLLLSRLSDYGIKEVVICSNSSDPTVRQCIQSSDYRMDLRFSEFKLPTGTAGSLRDAACGDRNALWMVFPASMVHVPDIEELVEAHDRGRCEMTAVMNPSDSTNGDNGQATGIYICEPSVLDYIPQGGYFDIKESLIPELLRASKNIYAARLSEPVGNFRNSTEYLSAVCDDIERKKEKSIFVSDLEKDPAGDVWKGPNVSVSSSARIYGPVVIMDNAKIADDAVIFGPAIIGRHVTIGANSLIVNSVLWDCSCVGAECRVEQGIVGSHAVVPYRSGLYQQVVLPQPEHILKRFAAASGAGNHSSIENGKSARCCRGQIMTRLTAVLSGVLLAAFIWSNWFTLKDLWEIWQRSDEYSSGLLVPFLAAYILWVRRERFTACTIKPSLWGLLIFAAAQAIKFFGLFFMYSSMERFSIVLSIAGIMLFLLGWNCFRKAFTVLLFLCLMLPLPASIHSSLLLPLQTWSTSSAVFCLEVIGYDVIQTGNIIDINGTTVAVIEACNGLRMIMAFFVIGGFIVLLSRRAKWEKLLVFLSGVPIALVCNTVRLTVTAIAFTFVEGEYWESLFHDFGGYAMMPFAIGIIVLEFWLLSKMVMTETGNQPVNA